MEWLPTLVIISSGKISKGVVREPNKKITYRNKFKIKDLKIHSSRQ